MKALVSRYHWRIAEFNRSVATGLAESAGVPPLVAHMLALRGINSAGRAKDFLRPSISQLSDPMDLMGMKEAVARISRARDRLERVLVFGDYDVDGIAATALLVRGLRRYGLNHVEYGLPDRFGEGYGLGVDRVEHAHREGCDLLITVDNGVTAHDAANRAKELGLDLIITDHHSIERELPHAVALINPKRDPKDHFAHGLAGAGVAFKLASQLNGAPHDLDLAALGTVADIVPLKDENRVIVSLGIKHMIRYGRTGLAQLAKIAKFDIFNVTSRKIAFQLAPRMNAVGRLSSARAALEILLTDCEQKAAELAAILNSANEERRQIENEIYDEAVEMLDAFFDEKRRSIVVVQKGWHQGVIGIVAARLLARYARPVVIGSADEEDIVRASARAASGFDLMAALQECRQHFIRYGGHASAAGMSFPASALEPFQRDFERAAAKQMGEARLRSELHADAWVGFTEINAALIRHMEAMEPFGQGNPEPMFCSANVEIHPQSFRLLQDRHLKMSLKQGDTTFNAIGFYMADHFFLESLPRRVDIMFTPQLNTYNGETTIQLNLKDIRATDEDMA